MRVLLGDRMQPDTIRITQYCREDPPPSVDIPEIRFNFGSFGI